MMNYTNRALGVFLFKLWRAQVARPHATLLSLKMTYSGGILKSSGPMLAKWKVNIASESILK